MNKNKFSQILMPVIVLTAIATVMALLLGATNFLTEKPIEKLQKQAETTAVSSVIKAEEYKEGSLEFEGSKYTYYSAYDSGVLIGYAFNVSANGYGGAVTSIVGVNIDGSISAVEITDLSGETPGLGQNAGKEDFKSSFAGKSGEVTVVKGTPKDNEIKAVTGATITSKAVASSVNLALDLYKAVSEVA